MELITIHEGPWWCPACSQAFAATLSPNHGEAACSRCGTLLEA